MRKDYAAKGFTLFSILSSLAISSILLSLGIPVTSSFVSLNKLSADLNLLHHQLAYARTLAIETNDDVVICKSQDQSSCNAVGNWGQGWIMFRDSNHNMGRDADEPLLQVQGKVREGLEIQYSGFGSGQVIVFRGTGTTSTNGTFSFCEQQSSEVSRALIINRMGRIRVSDKNHSCSLTSNAI